MSCVTREVTLPVDADEAWETVTELDEWLAEDADVELEPGRGGHADACPTARSARVVVEEVEPGERLEFWWWADDEPRDATLS